MQIRTTLFPHNKAGNQNTTPNPSSLFRALADAMRESWANCDFKLPTLAEILHEAQQDDPERAAERAAPAPAQQSLDQEEPFQGEPPRQQDEPPRKRIRRKAQVRKRLSIQAQGAGSKAAPAHEV